MSVRHNGVGLVVLKLTARNGSPGSWMVEIEIPIEPGALDEIAIQVRALTRAA